ncbi:DUF5785 family protein [Haloarchaeobius sp. FL176]|uniref:DUF5785 family protein n=1 Tax=Haloarchaeobius sp. FL176 TaxID=2967129 RepID=UPI0021498298|nr:DUF5785 family protein [Haloarchaeobius sp. FL176]
MSNQWPHDPDGEQGSEGMRKYGMAVLAKKLDEDEGFPLKAAEFVEEHGDEPIRLNSKRVVSVADIFEHVGEGEFEDIVSFHKAVGNAMRSGGFWEFHPKAGESNIKHA